MYSRQNSLEKIQPSPQALFIKHQEKYVCSGNDRNIFENVQILPSEAEFVQKVIQKLNSIGIKVSDDLDQTKILRYGYQNNLSPEKTVEKIQKYLQWRNIYGQKGLHDISKQLLVEGVIYTFGKDTFHRPLIFIDFQNLQQFENEMVVSSLDDYFIEAMAYLFRRIEQNAFIGGKVENWIIICDARSIAFSLEVEKVIKYLLNLLSLVFPCRLERLIVLDQTFSMKKEFQISSLFLTQFKKSKLLLLEESDIDKLHENVSPNNLQIKFGGKIKDLDQYWPPQSVAAVQNSSSRVDSIGELSHLSDKDNDYKASFTGIFTPVQTNRQTNLNALENKLLDLKDKHLRLAIQKSQFSSKANSPEKILSNQSKRQRFDFNEREVERENIIPEQHSVVSSFNTLPPNGGGGPSGAQTPQQRPSQREYKLFVETNADEKKSRKTSQDTAYTNEIRQSERSEKYQSLSSFMTSPLAKKGLHLIVQSEQSRFSDQLTTAESLNHTRRTNTSLNPQKIQTQESNEVLGSDLPEFRPQQRLIDRSEKQRSGCFLDSVIGAFCLSRTKKQEDSFEEL